MTDECQLFLSKRLVTETKIFDGGVLVDERGVIVDILDRNGAEMLITKSKGKLKVTDGGEWALLAGVVDSHVHVNEPGRTAWEGFRTATNAAAAGGITTIVDMPLNSIPPTTTLENLKTKIKSAAGHVYVDVGFWGGVIVGNQDSLRDLVKAGVVGFKCFLCPSGVDEFPNVGAKDLELAFNALEGSGSVLAFHAELEDDTSSVEKNTSEKDPEDYNTYLASRPPRMELNAITLITSFLERTDVRVHVVHVSSASVVPLLETARATRLATGNQAWRGGVTAETCHHYLTLSASDVPRGHSEYKCAPPIRDSDNKEKLWKYLLDDKLDLVVSDHSPCTPDLKCSNTLEAWGGISSVTKRLQSRQKSATKTENIKYAYNETHFFSKITFFWLNCLLYKGYFDIPSDNDFGEIPEKERSKIYYENLKKLYYNQKKISKVAALGSWTKLLDDACDFIRIYFGFEKFCLSLFWTQATRRGLDLRSISKYLSAGPAHLCGLQDRKGALKPGLDADLVYFDPDESFVVTPDIIRHKNKLTPYIGKQLKGVVKKTYVRGQLVFGDGDIIGEPKGKLLIKDFD